MIRVKHKLSLIVVLAIITLFSIKFSSKIDKVVAQQDTCVCAYDGFGYYMYLPSLINNGTLDMQHTWALQLQREYCDDGIPVYQLHPVPDNKYVDIYHMGLALVELPSYLVGHLFATLFDYKKDGFSLPYHIAYLLNALFFIILGVVYLRKLLLQFFNDSIASLVIFTLYLCSNIYPTFIDAYQLPHLYLFAINAIFLYHLFKYTNTNQRKNLIFSTLFFGVSCFVRPTQAIWGIIPLIVLWNKMGLNRTMMMSLGIFPLSAILFNIPQLIYWKIIGGQLFMINLHTEDIVLSNPHFWEFLFSYRKGWLLYTPFFLLLIPGFIGLFRSKKQLFTPFLTFVFLNIYVLCSWECWWYAASYSSRVMIDSYPLLAIIIGFAFVYLAKSKLSLIITSVFILLCSLLNVVQLKQYFNYHLHVERMTKQHYWYIFGRTSIPNYEDYRLEIERGDLHWPEKVQFKNDPHFSIKTQPVYELQKAVYGKENFVTYIDKIELSEHLSTDETLFEITIKCKTSDSTSSVQLRFEQSKKDKIYGWNSFELSKDLPQDSWNTLTFKANESPIRTWDDFILLHAVSEGNASIEIDSMKIVAHSLIRK